MGTLPTDNSYGGRSLDCALFLERLTDLAAGRRGLWLLILVDAEGESGSGGLAGRADLYAGGWFKEDVDARLVVVDDGTESMIFENWCWGVKGALVPVRLHCGAR